MLPGKAPKVVLIGLWLTILLDTAVQILWKSSVTGIPDEAGLVAIVAATVTNPLFWGVLAIFAAQFYVWIKVIEKADLSYAQPITALSLVSVCFVSALFLGEEVGIFRSAGIGLILVGVWLISGTDHSSGALSPGALSPGALSPVDMLVESESGHESEICKESP